MRLILIALTLSLVVLQFPSSVGDSGGVPPLPGEVRVINALHPEDEGCAGELLVDHAPLSTSDIGRIIIRIEPTCSAIVAWQLLEPQTVRGTYPLRNISATYETIAADFLHLSGVADRNAAQSDCPRVVANFTGHSAVFWTGWDRDRDGNLNGAESPTSFEFGDGLMCGAEWVQKWQPLDVNDLRRYKLNVTAARSYGNGASLPYEWYGCGLHSQTMSEDQLRCWERPDDLVPPENNGSKYTWGGKTHVGSVESMTTNLFTLPDDRLV